MRAMKFSKWGVFLCGWVSASAFMFSMAGTYAGCFSCDEPFDVKVYYEGGHKDAIFPPEVSLLWDFVIGDKFLTWGGADPVFIYKEKTVEINENPFTVKIQGTGYADQNAFMSIKVPCGATAVVLAGRRMDLKDGEDGFYLEQGEDIDKDQFWWSYVSLKEGEGEDEGSFFVTFSVSKYLNIRDDGESPSSSLECLVEFVSGDD